jgi:hypothetical protein
MSCLPLSNGHGVCEEVVAASGAEAPAATAQVAVAIPAPSAGPHPVVLVGISGLLWSDISPVFTPNLWRLAASGSVGNLVVYAVDTLTCPADGWLTLNSGARALAPRPAPGRCSALPPVASLPTGRTRTGRTPTGRTPGTPVAARVPVMPSLVAFNRQFSENPDWGLLAGAARPGNCATAIGPGAALALSGPAGYVGHYLPSAASAGAAAFARCRLTVADLGAVPVGRQPPGHPARAAVIRADDRALGWIRAELPRGAILVVAAPADGAVPHLHPIMISGPGYGPGLLGSAATRQPGLVTLTDLAPTLLRWREVPVPPGAVGSPLTTAPRSSLAAAVRTLTGQDTQTQVYAETFGWFFVAYGAAEAAAFGGIALIWRGGQPERRRRRAALWRVAGVLAAAVPAGTYLAGLFPWSLQPHPAAWLYGLTACWAAVIGAAALAGPWRRDPLGPPGVVGAMIAAVIAADVITGSRLQLGTPFGLSVTTAGRFYGLGNHEVVLYAAAALFCAGWLGTRALRRGDPARARTALLTVAGVGLAVVAVSGWPGLGAKVGGTFAMVPAFAILLMAVANVRITPRRAAAAVACGAALVVALALVNYLAPATGPSDIGGFFGQVLHGGAGGTLSRKIGSNVASLTASDYALIVPPVVVLAGLALARPSWFALTTLPRAWAASPLLRATLTAVWVVAVLGWFAEDSGVAVPASGLPFVLPLAIAAASAAAYPASATAGHPAAGHPAAGRPASAAGDPAFAAGDPASASAHPASGTGDPAAGPPPAAGPGRSPRQAILDLPP